MILVTAADVHRAAVTSPITVGNRPFEAISIDLKPMPTTDEDTGCDAFLAVRDRFSGWFIALPCHQDDDAVDYLTLLRQYVYLVYGTPKVILCDHDKIFGSSLFVDTHRRWGTSVSLGTPYHYRTSGGIEGPIKTVQDQLNILTEKTDGRGKNWMELLPRAVEINNKKTNQRTGLCPAEILLGYRPSSPFDLLAGNLEDQLEPSLALEEYLVSRDADRQRHRDHRRQMAEKIAANESVQAGKAPAYRPGHWVVLHKRAFGQHAERFNKLESREAYGPYRILAVDWDRGRLQVELGNDFTKGKTNWFTMDDVRKHWVRRPWHSATVTVEERLAANDNHDEEYEVDGIASRKYTYGKYRYSVSFKGFDECHKHLPRTDPDLENCQALIDEFDRRHPFGSLPYDKPSDKDAFLSTQQGPTRRSTRLRHALGEIMTGCWRLDIGSVT